MILEHQGNATWFESTTIGFGRFQMGEMSVKKQTSSMDEAIFEIQTKEEIEAKWQRLIARTDKSPVSKASVIPPGTRVIRRRKGRKDLPIA